MRWLIGIWKFLVSLVSFIKDEQDERQQDFDEYRIRIFDPECNRLLIEYKRGSLILTDFVYQYGLALHAMIAVFSEIAVVSDGQQRLTIRNDSTLLFAIYSDWISRGKELPPGIAVLTSDVTGQEFKELRTRISVTNTVHGKHLMSVLYLDTTQDLLGLEFKPV